MTSLLDILAEADRLPTVSLAKDFPPAGLWSVVIGVHSDGARPGIVDPHAQLDPKTRRAVEVSLDVLSADWHGSAVILAAPASSPYDFITLTGLDDADPTADSTVRLRRAAGSAARASERITDLTFALPVESAADVRAVIEGALLGGYSYPGVHGSQPDTATARTVEIDVLGGDAHAGQGDVTAAVEAARATRLSRTFVDLPPNLLYPSSFAHVAAHLARDAGIDVEIKDADALRAEGFGGLIGVGQGSEHEPALVRVDYVPDEPARGHLAFVGKGITYDAGGINLKLSHQDYMNFDMSGAAAVLAAALACARLRVPVRVTAWMALAENVPSGTSQRPSDVLTLRDGTTVEVRDTDAEGRLVLADALVAAIAEHPDVVVDIATLTGAQQIALGDRVTGLMSNDDDLASELDGVATSVDERLWRMPLPVDLADGLRSRVADIANKADRPGGMLTAALFLEHIVSRAESVPRWAHLDICGPAINRKKPYGFTTLGGTGVGARTLLALAQHTAE